MTQQRLFVFGFGYTAQALARVLLPQGWAVIGTTRDPSKTTDIQRSGAQVLLWDDTAAIADALAASSHLLIAAGPDADGDPSLRAFGPQITSAAAQLTWAGYLSTTGVYGDAAGHWVDETSPLTPSTQRGQRRLAAEQKWQAIPDLPLHIFRLAGIYGPGRGPFAKLRAGRTQSVIKPNQFFSRAHVDDIAAALAASMARPNPGAAYNICDDLPAPPEDVLRFAAQIAGLPAPVEVPFEQATLTPMGRSFYAESKKVSNARMKAELGITLNYPDYQAGLRALLEQESAQ